MSTQRPQRIWASSQETAQLGVSMAYEVKPEDTKATLEPYGYISEGKHYSYREVEVANRASRIAKAQLLAKLANITTLKQLNEFKKSLKV